MMAQTRSGFTGETVTPMMPCGPSGRPSFSISDDHVAPPSVDFQSSEPGPPDEKSYGVRRTFHVLAYSTSGFTGSNTRSTAPARSLANKTHFQVAPPSVDL